MTTTADELCATGSTAAVPGAVRTSGRGFRLRPVAAFAGTALAFVAVALAVGAPSPLFVLYEQEWGFAPWLLTVAFAIYAVTLLITLLVAGSLSDHIGRRPVLIGALALQVVAMLMFLFATDIGWIIAARSVQGVATGAAMSTFTAALVELAPEKQKKLGATIGSTAPVGGIALGAFFTGLAVQFASAPTVLVFVTLALLFAAGIVVVAASPETVRRRPGAVRSLVPRLVIPRAARGEFVGAIPLFLATWMLAGLFIGLSPSILHGVFHLDSGLLNGAIVAVPPAVGAVAGLALTRAPARRTTVWAMAAIVAGIVLAGAGIAAAILPLLFAGATVAGAGFGAGFSAMLRILAPLAPNDKRAELFAGIFLVSYLAYGVPALVAGELIATVGLLPTVLGYAVAIAAAAIVALVVQAARVRRELTPGR
ncbi:MFS transporter [Leifsonia aquatica]|uniref:Putative MFS family arabinose efflux permease n=3 Tax=Leifsonia aquatica TaxID=144185 RepID=A0A7W4UWB1_LEIAQ|nr:MFS transporter [Leifsonia aquatica]MBB2967480.1 putative MFS family arabinose efflux permease [Leifsonia aquatica]